MQFFLLSLLLLSVSYAYGAIRYGAAALEDEVTDLPGLNDEINFRQFSGYLEISDTKKIHYWFTESENDPANDPVVFWTNGGPGCSGLIGFMTEQGAFRPQSDMSLELNEWRWNKIANMVYIEQPVGVGFSYTDDDDEYHTGDKQAAQDNYQVLLKFMEKFDSYGSNDVYITSESYGGHYMPTWAAEIVSQNNSDINFKGFAVGNPYNNFYSGSGAMLDTYWGHQLVDGMTWNTYQKECSTTQEKLSNKCSLLEAKLGTEIGNLNPYALDYPVCLEDDSPRKAGRAQRLWLLDRMLPEHLKESLLPMTSEEYEPCTDNYATQYLNQADVKDAIHVKSNIVWSECSVKMKYHYVWEVVPMTPIYPWLLNQDLGLNILVYSGDDDSVCATIGTQSWIYDLGYETTNLWDVWTSEGQVAGYQTQFEVENSNNFAFVTVHGAGHEVPTYKPQAAYELFSYYLDGSIFEGV